MGVNTFHICQVNELLWPQMVLLQQDTYRKRHVTDESNDNNADNEESANTTQEGDLETKRNENRKCFGCQKTMGQITQYCMKCWNKERL